MSAEDASRMTTSVFPLNNYLLAKTPYLTSLGKQTTVLVQPEQWSAFSSCFVASLIVSEHLRKLRQPTPRPNPYQRALGHRRSKEIIDQNQSRKERVKKIIFLIRCSSSLLYVVLKVSLWRHWMERLQTRAVITWIWEHPRRLFAVFWKPKQAPQRISSSETSLQKTASWLELNVVMQLIGSPPGSELDKILSIFKKLNVELALFRCAVHASSDNKSPAKDN